MIKLAAAAAFSLAAYSTGATAQSCEGATLTPTATWNTSCTDLTNGGAADCWIGEVPRATSTVLFPAGTDAVLETILDYKPKSTLDTPTEITAAPFDIIQVANVVIAEGATVEMQGGAIQVTNCFQVLGKLELVSQSYYTVPWSQVPTGEYLADPEQPEGTDCKLVSVGFTPRVCGPGKLQIVGNVSLTGLYSSLFLGATVSEDGFLGLNDQSFYWGELENLGTVNATGLNYQHGFFTNRGSASMSAVAFDVWATDFTPLNKPLLVTNFGTLDLAEGSPSHFQSITDVYRTLLINHGTVMLSAVTTPQGLDVINLGTVTFDAPQIGWASPVFEGYGSWINRGTLITDGVEVWLIAFQSYGGKLVMNNYGTFNLGNGNNGAAARASMRLCRLTSDLPSDLQLQYLQNSKRRRDEARHMTLSSVLSSVQGNDGCFWYADICYHQPYLFGPPTTPSPAFGRRAVREARMREELSVDPTGLPVHRHNGQVRLHIQRTLVQEDVFLDAASCDTRLKLEDTELSGDGTGSLSSTYPVDVEGNVEIGTGGNWYVSSEHGMAPLYGSGKVVVKSGGTFFAGIDADFRLGGAMDVRRGGMLAIPKHAKVVLSNFSLSVRPGAKLHVDGDLSFHEAHASQLIADVCGVVGGIGDLRVDKEGRLGCSVDQRLYDALHREQPLKQRQVDAAAGVLPPMPPSVGGRQ